MKKKNHTIEELLRAAREESPVVSFSDTAEQIARLEAKSQKRRGFAWFSERAFAFPNAAWKSIHHSAHVLSGKALDKLGNASEYAHIFSPLSTHLVRGVSLAAFVLMLFPALTHDLRFGDIHLSKLLPKTSSNQAMATLVLENTTTKSHTNTSRSASNHATYSAFSSTNTANNTTSNESSTQPTNPVKDALSPSVAESNVSAYPSLATESRRFQERPPSEKSLVFKNERQGNDVQGNESKVQASSNTANAPTETSFWQRLSVEARMASRTELANAGTGSSNTAAFAGTGTDAQVSATRFKLDTKSQQQFASESASPLQNIALGIQFALDEHHSIGLEGGTEPFLTAIQPPTDFSLAQQGDPNRIETIIAQQPTDGSGNQPRSSMTVTMPTQQPGVNVNVGVTSTLGVGVSQVPSFTQPASVLTQRTISAETRNRAWFGVSYQYSFSIIPVLGGVQPLTRVSVGGGEIGLVSRGIIGVRFLPQSQVSVMLAGEGTGIARQNILSENAANATWEFAPRLGMTLGIAIKF